MKPVLNEEIIDREAFEYYIQQALATKRTLLSGDCKDKNMVGMAYDAGYMAALTEIKQIFCPVLKSMEGNDA
ncbi:MAG: hypothetical protein IKU15_00290 [Clostridia bacterium]|nr:hypothetical protein [Clostridia bacterium]